MVWLSWMSLSFHFCPCYWWMKWKRKIYLPWKIWEIDGVPILDKKWNQTFKRSWQIFCQNCLIVLQRLKVSMNHRSYLHTPRMNSVSDLPESCCPSVELLLMEDKLHTLSINTLYKLFLVLNPCLPVTGFACCCYSF